MRNHDFILASGAKLHVTRAAFELAVVLKETVDAVMVSLDPSWDEMDPRVIGALLCSAKVREAWLACAVGAIYETYPVNVNLFNDPKIGEQAFGDYHEIASKIIKVNRDPFFLKTSSVSKASPLPLTENQESS